MKILIIQISIEEKLKKEDSQVITEISKKIINNLNIIFQKKNRKKEIRKINTKVAALIIYSMIFQSVLLWKFFRERTC